MTQQAGQAPERGQSGSFLNQSSTPGAKVNFIDSTNEGSTGAISVSAGGTASVEIDVSIYDPLLPTSARTSENVKGWDECIVWPFYNIFIDNDNNFNYEYAVGALLSSGQQNISISIVELISPNSGSSHSISVLLKNHDSSDHTIYLHVGAKYAITG